MILDKFADRVKNQSENERLLWQGVFVEAHYNLRVENVMLLHYTNRSDA